MKLEFKHIAPYLPFDLKIFWLKSKESFGITYDENTDYKRQLYPLSTIIFCIEQKNKDLGFALILRPLSDLHLFEKEITARWGEGLGGKTLETWLKYVIEDMTTLNYNTLRYDQVEFMFENHFDVFKLIPAGLAIDINTLPNV